MIRPAPRTLVSFAPSYPEPHLEPTQLPIATLIQPTTCSVTMTGNAMTLFLTGLRAASIIRPNLNSEPGAA